MGSQDDDLFPCDYCPEYFVATFRVNRIDVDCNFNVTRCCDLCANGWRDISVPLNSHVV